MTNRRPARKRGFTLIETLLYIGLFGILLTSMVMIAYPLMTGADRLNQRVTEEGEAAFVLHKVSAALHTEKISSISVASQTLTINRAGGPDSISIREESGEIKMEEGGTELPLTGSRTGFSNFLVTYTASTGGNIPHTVTVQFDIGGESYSRTYHVYF